MRKWRTFLGSQVYPTPIGYRCTDVWDADASIVRAWQTVLRTSGLRPATINQLLASVSSFYEFVLATGTVTPHLKENPFRGNIRRERIEEYHASRPLSVEEYKRLLTHLESHSTSLTGARAHALLRTFLHTGWRAQDLLSMRWGDLKPLTSTPGTMRYGWLTPKGERCSDTLPADCWQAIRHYLALAGRTPETLAATAYLWTPVRMPDLAGLGAKPDPDRPICSKTALRIMRTHVAAAGIVDADSFRLHDLRHTHTLLLLETGASIETVQRRLRHASRHTTERYIRNAFPNDQRDAHSAAFSALRAR
jgi:integrase